MLKILPIVPMIIIFHCVRYGASYRLNARKLAARLSLEEQVKLIEGEIKSELSHIKGFARNNYEFGYHHSEMVNSMQLDVSASGYAQKVQVYNAYKAYNKIRLRLESEITTLVLHSIDLKVRGTCANYYKNLREKLVLALVYTNDEKQRKIEEARTDRCPQMTQKKTEDYGFF